MKQSTLYHAILSVYGANPFKPMNYKQVAKVIGIRDKAGKDMVYNTITLVILLKFVLIVIV